MTDDDEGGSGVAAPAGWQDWRYWADGVDWSDWRAWLQRDGEISLTVQAFAEDEPGDRIRDHLALTWPAFRQWWRDGANSRPPAARARARLEEHMPELGPAWQRLTADWDYTLSNGVVARTGQIRLGNP